MNVKKLDIDFEIPDFLQEDIDALIERVNTGGLYDCECDEVYGSINMTMVAGAISVDEATLLRDYYCFGGMFKGEKFN